VRPDGREVRGEVGRVVRFQRLRHLAVEQGAPGAEQTRVSDFTQAIVAEIEPTGDFAKNAPSYEFFQPLRELVLGRTRRMLEDRHVEVAADHGGDVAQARGALA
jgi:hypothetical protein